MKGGGLPLEGGRSRRGGCLHLGESVSGRVFLGGGGTGVGQICPMPRDTVNRRRRYASYWIAFLLQIKLDLSVLISRPIVLFQLP